MCDCCCSWDLLEVARCHVTEVESDQLHLHPCQCRSRGVWASVRAGRVEQWNWLCQVRVKEGEVDSEGSVCTQLEILRVWVVVSGVRRVRRRVVGWRWHLVRPYLGRHQVRWAGDDCGLHDRISLVGVCAAVVMSRFVSLIVMRLHLAPPVRTGRLSLSPILLYHACLLWFDSPPRTIEHE